MPDVAPDIEIEAFAAPFIPSPIPIALIPIPIALAPFMPAVLVACDPWCPGESRSLPWLRLRGGVCRYDVATICFTDLGLRNTEKEQEERENAGRGVRGTGAVLTSVRSYDERPDVRRVDAIDGCVFVTMLVSPCVGRVFAVAELVRRCPTVAPPLALSGRVYKCLGSSPVLREGLW